jgi:voltage-gated potassium channel
MLMITFLRRFFRAGIKWNISFLLLVIFTVFFIPFFPLHFHRELFNSSFTLIFLIGYLTSDRKHPFFIPVAVGAVILVWIAGFFKLPVLFFFSALLNVILFSLVVLSMITHLAGSASVTARIIIESIITYLLVGLIYSMAVGLIDLYDPHAFSFPHASTTELTYETHLSTYIYFTFVTLTTTGFGDMVPLEPYSRSLTTLIAITGQMYVAIIISILVGKYATQARVEKSEE